MVTYFKFVIMKLFVLLTLVCFIFSCSTSVPTRYKILHKKQIINNEYSKSNQINDVDTFSILNPVVRDTIIIYITPEN